MTKPVFRGHVKFFEAEQGLGGIESDKTPGDVWVHHSVIEGPEHRTLVPGDEVEFRFEAAREPVAVRGNLGSSVGARPPG